MARPKLGDSETERLHIKISADELSAIEDWRYSNRVPSKSEAVRRLVQMGLRLSDSGDGVQKAAKATTEHMLEFWHGFAKILEEDSHELMKAKLALHLMENANRLLDNQLISHARTIGMLNETGEFLRQEDFAEGLRAADAAKAETALSLERLRTEIKESEAEK